MPLDLFNELTQLMPQVLEPRYRAMKFENGVLIPTMVDLDPGIKEIAYPEIKQIGDAEIMSDAATDIPMVQITGSYNRYPVYMMMSSFPVTFQESRLLSRTIIDGIEQRMTVARIVIVQRTNMITALGKTGMNFDGALTNPLIAVDDSTVDIYADTYQNVLDFFVSTVESLTGNYVTDEPSDMLINSDQHALMISLENAQGTRNIKQRLQEIFPGLTITKIPEGEAAYIDGAISRPSAGKDRIFLYPKEARIIHRHLEAAIADLVPEEYTRTATIDGQVARVYMMFSCLTPAIVNFPNDCRYVDIPARA